MPPKQWLWRIEVGQGGPALSSTKERRAHRRISTHLLVQGSPEKGGTMAQMVASNISLGGVYCTSSADFPEMTRLAVRLMLPLGEGPARNVEGEVEAEAVVVRRRQLSARANNPRYELALFFTRLDPQARKLLERYLERVHLHTAQARLNSQLNQ